MNGVKVKTADQLKAVQLGTLKTGSRFRTVGGTQVYLVTDLHQDEQDERTTIVNVATGWGAEWCNSTKVVPA